MNWLERRELGLDGSALWIRLVIYLDVDLYSKWRIIPAMDTIILIALAKIAAVVAVVVLIYCSRGGKLPKGGWEGDV